MNNHQSDCDDEALDAMLRDDEATNPSEDLLAHIETCTRCQERLRELAGPAEMWYEVKVAISQTARSSQQCRFPPASLEQTAVQWTESMARQLLSPPTHPEMLGRLGRYEIERLIGSGGMGVVFKAFDTELNRPVAIYHLNSAPHPVFWLGLKDVKLAGPTRKSVARMQPAPEVTAFASVLLRSLLNGTPRRYDREGNLGAKLFAGRSCFSFFCPPFSCPRFP
jgi:hypothetical protein